MQVTMKEMAGSQRQMQGTIQVMQSAVQGLFERMDRFIRGLEGNGHKSA